MKKIIELEGDRIRGRHIPRIRGKLWKKWKNKEIQEDDEEKSQENKKIEIL